MDVRPALDLSASHLANLDARVQVPTYDRSVLRRGLVHVGVGGFHRAHQAVYQDDLCMSGLTDWAIVGAGVLPMDDAMATALDAQDRLYTVITRGRESNEVRVIGSIVDYVLASPSLDPLIGVLADPATRIVSLTITEGGYPVGERSGDFVPAADGVLPPAFEAIGRALAVRRREGRGGFTVLSCDNIMHNGVTAQTATLGVAETLEPGLGDWVSRHVTFPNTMVDRITPATTDVDRAFLAEEYGIIDRWPVVAEPFLQWVIEDSFVDGRPPWEDAGALFTTDVQPYETLKLRLLNAGHSCLAYLAALAGHEFVHDVLHDGDFAQYLVRFLDDEASPALPAVPGIDVPAYKAQLIERFGNPEIRDQVSRLCLDGTSKFPKFLVPTIEAQLDRNGSTRLAALALAGWCQYLLGEDERGRPLEVAYDPNLETATEFARASLSDPAAFLAFESVFGPKVGSSGAFRKEFVDALASLRSAGVHSTIDRLLRRDG